MESLLLLLLLLVASASAFSSAYRYFGGSVSVSPKGRNADGRFEVELRYKQATFYCYVNPYTCKYGSCGIQGRTAITTKIAWESYGLNWCLQETAVRLQLNTNLPFGIRFPARISFSSGIGYWVSNVFGGHATWRMLAHLDLGLRSDTRRSNSPPVAAMLPIVRVTRNCPRRFNLNVFDRDGDRVRCRVATNHRSDECGLCKLPRGFEVDEDSCSVSYSFSGTIGYHPIEFVLEDFPHNLIHLFYSTGHYTVKHPLPLIRHKRQLVFESPSIFTTTERPTTSTTTERPITSRMTERPTTSTTTESSTTTNFFLLTSPSTSSSTTPSTTTSFPATTSTTAAQTTALPSTLTSTTAASTSTPFDGTIITPLLKDQQFFSVSANRFLPSISPLSRLPLQFSVLVDSHNAPSCVDGDYFPIFLSPTPAHGAHLPAIVGRTLEFHVQATAQFSTIYRLLLTGPSGIRQRSTSRGYYVLTWTPTEYEQDCHFPVCFVSEAYARGRVYHSELRCLVVDVVRFNTVVTCSQTGIKVEVEKTDLIRSFEDQLHLRDGQGAQCELSRRSNSTHLVAVVPLNSCGTYVEEDKENITFRNEITSADPRQVISRNNIIDIAFCCVYPRKTNLTLGFRHKNPYAFKESGFGSFTFQFEFFQSQLFRRQVEGSSYPVEVYLKQMIYMQIQATSSIPNTQLFVESCRATPYDNPESSISYTIMEDGCVRDPTVQVYPGPGSVFRFGMEAFEFIGAHDEVYITCSVLLCQSGVPNTRCSQGCIEPGSGRSKREAPAQTSSHFISQGPLRLRASDSEVSGPSVNLGLNLVFIVGCLLVCGVVVIRSRRSRAQYQRLPTSESD